MTMTIPIQPGPWSFLAGIGETFGEIAKQKELQRRQDFEEQAQRRRDALAAIQVVGHLRDRGFISPEAFSHPDMIQTFELAGLPPPSATPTPGEIKNQGQASYLQSIGVDENLFGELEPQRGNLTQSGVSRPATPRQPLNTEQRIAIGAPTQADVLKPTAEAENIPVQDYKESIDRLANEAVVQAWVSGGMRNLPTIQDARRFLDANPNVAPFKDKITDGAIANAIEQLRRVRKQEEYNASIAAAQHGRGTSDTASRRITSLEKQRDNEQKDIEYYRSPIAIVDPRIRKEVEKAAAQGRKVEPRDVLNVFIAQAEKRVEAIDKEIERLNVDNPLPSGAGGGEASTSSSKIVKARINIVGQYPRHQWMQAADHYFQTGQLTKEEYDALKAQLDQLVTGMAPTGGYTPGKEPVDSSAPKMTPPPRK